MKKELLIAGMMLSCTNAMASEKVEIPEICKSVANYAAQSLDLRFEDGSFADKHDPNLVRMHKDFRTFPITEIKDLGSCDDGNNNIKQSWCQVAGGSPEVYQLEIAKNDGANGTYPHATVVVTFNRGGCWVDSAEIK